MKGVTVFLLSLLVATAACNDGPSEMGADFLSPGNLDVVYIDTLTLTVSTVQYDSLITSSASRMLVGSHRDAKLGLISACAFFSVGLASVDDYDLNPEETTYRKAVLILPYDGYSFYDTTVQSTYNVHRLTTEIENEEGGVDFYNTQKFPHETNSLGAVTFTPRPGTADTLEIKLNDTFGEELMQLMWTESTLLDEEKLFLTYLKGLAVIPEGDASAIVGFTTSPSLRVYYTDKTTLPTTEKYVEFPVGKRFNSVTHERSGLPLQRLTTLETALLSTETEGMAFLQGSVGLAMRVEIPYLKSILTENPELLITRAVLEFAPVANTYTTSLLPTSLLMFGVDEDNEVLQEFEDVPILVKDYFLGRDTHYEVLVSDFVSQQLATEENNNNALLVRFSNSDFLSTANRLYIGDSDGEYEMKLRLYFAVFKD